MSDLSPHVPTPSEPQGGTKPPKPQLTFANTSVRLHPDDLPPEYEPTEIYRGLDEYVSARRAVRRIKRREARRIHRNEDVDSADDRGKEDGDDSDSSSSSSDDNGPMVISRLRALFGDSSDSSSSSSSSSDDSSSDDDASIESATTSRRSMDNTDHMSIRSGRSRRENSATPSLSSAFPPWTPKLSALTGTRRRKKRRRRRTQKEDKHMVKSSRMARRNARRLRQLAGGVTEYIIFAFTDDSQPDVFTSQSWKAIRKRLDQHFQYLIQSDGHAGDLGLPAPSLMATASQVISPAILLTDEDEHGDLALPPPALDVNQTNMIPDKEATWDEQEAQTGRHMSDIPLTPFFRSTISGELAHSPTPFSQLAKYPDKNRSSAGPIPTIVEEEDEMANLVLPEAALDIKPPPPTHLTPKPIPDPISPSFTPSLISRRVLRNNPWWLDIRCPTYKVMQQLSLQFPLHPLTVEDILKQEQREKVELFERLGYYFVVVRALDEHYFRFNRTEGSAQSSAGQPSPSTLEHQVRSESKSKKQGPDLLLQTDGRMQIEMVKSEDAKEGLEGIGAGSLSMYMVVFNHGVITFHFEDMSTHINRVRDRLTNTDAPIPHNADWIVHSLYDSVVDSFSPYVSFLQNEVDYIESLLHVMSLKPFDPEEEGPKHARRLFRRSRTAHSTKARKAAENMAFESLTNLPNANTDYIQYLRRRAERIKSFSTFDAIQQSLFILHLTRVREVVMGLNRLLLPKSDVIRGLRKRIVELHRDASEETFIALYFDDITDHIASMLTQLQDREAGLNSTHSSFLTRASVSEQKFNLQKVKVLVNVSVFITFIFCIQLLCSAFGMNVLVPSDNSSAGDDPDSIDENRVHPSYHGFGGIICGVAVIPCIVYAYAAHLKRRSRILSKQKAAHW